jgi:transcription elongation factor GreA
VIALARLPDIAATVDETRICSTMANRDQGEAVYLTADGRRRLEEELEHLTTVERAAIAARLNSAIKDGDLSENAAYTAAKEDQGHLEGRIAQIQASLRRAVIIDESSGSSQVVLGSRVTVEDEDGVLTYQLVGPLEAAPAEGRISNQSPVGRALMGHSAGDEIEIETPGGTMTMRIVSIA